jgi:hypothetical protein
MGAEERWWVMITEERLKELETEGKMAQPYREEFRELVAAYRSTKRGLSVSKRHGEGVWLNFTSPSGLKASISVEVMAAKSDPLVGKCLTEWSDAQPCDFVLVTVDPNTGEIINRDGSVGGKVVPIEPSIKMQQQVVKERHGESTYKCMTQRETDLYEAEAFDDYLAILAASKVDLSGAVVELPKTVAPPRDVSDSAWNHCVNTIKAQMPKESK